MLFCPITRGLARLYVQAASPVFRTRAFLQIKIQRCLPTRRQHDRGLEEVSKRPPECRNYFKNDPLYASGRSRVRNGVGEHNIGVNNQSTDPIVVAEGHGRPTVLPIQTVNEKIIAERNTISHLMPAQLPDLQKSR